MRISVASTELDTVETRQALLWNPRARQKGVRAVIYPNCPFVDGDSSVCRGEQLGLRACCPWVAEPVQEPELPPLRSSCFPNITLVPQGNLWTFLLVYFHCFHLQRLDQLSVFQKTMLHAQASWFDITRSFLGFLGSFTKLPLEPEVFFLGYIPSLSP